LSLSLATSPVLATCGLDLDARARRGTRPSAMEVGRGLGECPSQAMLQSEAIVNIDLTPRPTLVSRLWPPKTLPWLDDALKHSLELTLREPLKEHLFQVSQPSHSPLTPTVIQTCFFVSTRPLHVARTLLRVSMNQPRNDSASRQCRHPTWKSSICVSSSSTPDHRISDSIIIR
jgi:hypothetical protein